MTVRLTATVIVVSDSVSRGETEDLSGALLCERLAAFGIDCSPMVIVADEVDAIRSSVKAANSDIVALTGGTGVGPRDVTPEAVEPMIEKRLHGVEQAIHFAGSLKNPRAMLSRLLAGTAGEQLLLCLPGSPSAVEDAVGAVFPAILHVFDVLEGRPH